MRDHYIQTSFSICCHGSHVINFHHLELLLKGNKALRFKKSNKPRSVGVPVINSNFTSTTTRQLIILPCPTRQPDIPSAPFRPLNTPFGLLSGFTCSYYKSTNLSHKCTEIGIVNQKQLNETFNVTQTAFEGLFKGANDVPLRPLLRHDVTDVEDVARRRTEFSVTASQHFHSLGRKESRTVPRLIKSPGPETWRPTMAQSANGRL